MVDKYEYKLTWSEEDQAYIAHVAEFPSLAAHGKTPELALKEIQFVVGAVIEDLQEHGEAVPEPLNTRSYSGKLNIRMPMELHKELVKESAWQNVSLNQLIVYKLSKNLGS